MIDRVNGAHDCHFFLAYAIIRPKLTSFFRVYVYIYIYI